MRQPFQWFVKLVIFYWFACEWALFFYNCKLIGYLAGRLGFGNLSYFSDENPGISLDDRHVKYHIACHLAFFGQDFLTTNKLSDFLTFSWMILFADKCSTMHESLFLKYQNKLKSYLNLIWITCTVWNLCLGYKIEFNSAIPEDKSVKSKLCSLPCTSN